MNRTPRMSKLLLLGMSMAVLLVGSNALTADPSGHDWVDGLIASIHSPDEDSTALAGSAVVAGCCRRVLDCRQRAARERLSQVLPTAQP